MSILLHMPPKSAWFVHAFRGKDDKLMHYVVCISERISRRGGTRAACAKLLTRDNSWRRPPGSTIVDVCPRCASVVAAMDDLLLEQ